MSGVWPRSAGGTSPPVAATKLGGSASPSASRSIECASARRQLDVRVRRTAVVEDEVDGPRGRPELDLGRDLADVGRAERGRLDRHELRPCLERLTQLLLRELDPPDVPGPAGLRPPLEHDPPLLALDLPERAADDVDGRLGPAVAVRLDRVPRLRRRVGPVDDAEEVRRRRREPELDRPLVERPTPTREASSSLPSA